MEARQATPATAVSLASLPLVELRQYTLHPGARETLIDLFDREFVETQEAVGISVLGQFRDLDRPNRFVWLRGFPDLPTRARALETFYSGPAWKAHAQAANATMIDSDDVLLLRPARPSSGFALDGSTRQSLGDGEVASGLIAATIYHLDAPADDAFIEFLERELVPALADTGASVKGSFVTEDVENNFPALPVREGENVFVWFAGFADPVVYEEHRSQLARSPRWRELAPALCRRLVRPPEVLRLSPTSRSLARP